jgi:hypothetical protein
MYCFCDAPCIVCFVTLPVLFVCICVLNNCHQVTTQLQLNISYHISFPGKLRTLLLAAAVRLRAATAGKLDLRRNNASYRPQHRIQIGFVLSTSCSESCGDNGTGQRWCWMGGDKDWEGGGLQRWRTSSTKVWPRHQLWCDDVHRLHNCKECTDCTRSFEAWTRCDLSDGLCSQNAKQCLQLK